MHPLYFIRICEILPKNIDVKLCYLMRLFTNTINNSKYTSNVHDQQHTILVLRDSSNAIERFYLQLLFRFFPW